MRYFDKLAYIFLYLGFVIGLGAIFMLRFDSASQFLVILALTIFYLVWGAVYHSFKKDLTRKLVLEYLLLGLISLGVGFLVFKS